MTDNPSSLTCLLQRLTSENPHDRAWAVIELRVCGDLQAVPALITALDDDDADVQLEAVKALSDLRDPRAIPVLFDLVNRPWDIFGDDDFHNEVYYTLRQQHAQSLKYLLDIVAHRDMGCWNRFGPHLYSHCTFLIEHGDLPLPEHQMRGAETLMVQIGLALLDASTDTHPKVREYALLGLKAFHGDPTVQACLLAGLHDPLDDVRHAAAQSLQSFDVAHDLLTLLRNADEAIRAAAVMSIGFRNAEANLDLFPLALDDPAPAVRCAAIESFPHWLIMNSESNAHRVLPRLCDCLHDTEPSVRARAIDLLRRIRELAPSLQPAFAVALSDPDDAVRRAAASAFTLEPIDDPLILDHVLSLVRDSNPGVRAAALEVLCRPSDQRILEVALDCAGDAEPEVRSRVLEIFRYYSDPRAQRVLEQARQDTCDDVVFTALRILIIRAGEDSLEFLALMLSHEWPGVRRCTIDRLSRMTTPQRIPLLIQALHDPMTASVAFRGLQGVSDLSYFDDETLQLLLNHPCNAIRSRMIEFIAVADDVRIIPMMIPRVRDKNEWIRSRTAELLTRRTGQTFGSGLTKWLHWWSAGQHDGLFQSE